MVLMVHFFPIPELRDEAIPSREPGTEPHRAAHGLFATSGHKE